MVVSDQPNSNQNLDQLNEEENNLPASGENGDSSASQVGVVNADIVGGNSVAEDSAETPAEEEVVEDLPENEANMSNLAVPESGNTFLPELATYHALREVAGTISTNISKVAFDTPSSVLILDDIDLVPKTFSYLDIQEKIEAYTSSIESLTSQKSNQLKPLIESMPETLESLIPHRAKIFLDNINLFVEGENGAETMSAWDDGVTGDSGDSGDSRTKKGIDLISPLVNGLSGVNPLFSGLTTTLGLVSDTLTGLNQVFEHFSTEYTLNDLTIRGISNVGIQAMVAGNLVSNPNNAKYELFKFEVIQQSPLLKKLNDLIKDFYHLYKSTEHLNALLVKDTAQIQLIETELSSKKEKLLELDAIYSDALITELEEEIRHLEQLYSDRITNRPSTTRITNLETYLSSLQSKFIEVLTSDSNKAIENLEREIKVIEEALKKDAAKPKEKQMSEVEKEILLKQLNIYQTQKSTLEMGIGSDPKQILEREIEKTSKKLDALQKEWYPDTHIEALENELKVLKAKLKEQLVQKSLAEKLVISVTDLENERTVLQNIAVKSDSLAKSGTTLLEAIMAFITKLTTPVAEGQHAPIILACIQEYLVKGGFTHLFYIQHVLSDADHISEEKGFLGRNAKNSYIGGGIVSYLLAKVDGQLVASGTVGDYVTLDYKLKGNPVPLNISISRSKDGIK